MLGIVEACPCINNDTPDLPVIGLLLTHTDGHRECAGQVRLEWIVGSIMVDKLKKLHFCGQRNQKS